MESQLLNTIKQKEEKALITIKSLEEQKHRHNQSKSTFYCDPLVGSVVKSLYEDDLTTLLTQGNNEITSLKHSFKLPPRRNTYHIITSKKSISKLIPIKQTVSQATEQYKTELTKHKLVDYSKDFIKSEASILKSAFSNIGSPTNLEVSLKNPILNKTYKVSKGKKRVFNLRAFSTTTTPTNIYETNFYNNEVNYYPLETFDFMEDSTDYNEILKDGPIDAQVYVLNIKENSYNWVKCKVLEYNSSLQIFRVEIEGEFGKSLHKHTGRLSLCFKDEDLSTIVERREKSSNLRSMHEAILRYSTALKMENEEMQQMVAPPVDRIKWIMRKVMINSKFKIVKVQALFQELINAYKSTAAKCVFDESIFHVNNYT